MIFGFYNFWRQIIKQYNDYIYVSFLILQKKIL